MWIILSEYKGSNFKNRYMYLFYILNAERSGMIPKCHILPIKTNLSILYASA